MPACSGLSDVSITSFSLLSSNATAIAADVTVTIFNPSSFVISNLGNLTLDMQVQHQWQGAMINSSIGVGTVTNANLTAGNSSMLLHVVMDPTTPAAYAALDEMMNLYVTGESPVVFAVAVGSGSNSSSAGSASSVSLFSGGLAGFAMSTSLPGFTGNLIGNADNSSGFNSSIVINSMSISPHSNDAYVSMTVDTQITLNSPLGLQTPLQVYQMWLVGVVTAVFPGSTTAVIIGFLSTAGGLTASKGVATVPAAFVAGQAPVVSALLPVQMAVTTEEVYNQLSIICSNSSTNGNSSALSPALTAVNGICSNIAALTPLSVETNYLQFISLYQSSNSVVMLLQGVANVQVTTALGCVTTVATAAKAGSVSNCHLQIISNISLSTAMATSGLSKFINPATGAGPVVQSVSVTGTADSSQCTNAIRIGSRGSGNSNVSMLSCGLLTTVTAAVWNPSKTSVSLPAAAVFVMFYRGLQMATLSSNNNNGMMLLSPGNNNLSLAGNLLVDPTADVTVAAIIAGEFLSRFVNGQQVTVVLSGQGITLSSKVKQGATATLAVAAVTSSALTTAGLSLDNVLQLPAIDMFVQNITAQQTVKILSLGLLFTATADATQPQLNAEIAVSLPLSLPPSFNVNLTAVATALELNLSCSYTDCGDGPIATLSLPLTAVTQSNSQPLLPSLTRSNPATITMNVVSSGLQYNSRLNMSQPSGAGNRDSNLLHVLNNANSTVNGLTAFAMQLMSSTTATIGLSAVAAPLVQLPLFATPLQLSGMQMRTNTTLKGFNNFRNADGSSCIQITAMDLQQQAGDYITNSQQLAISVTGK